MANIFAILTAVVLAIAAFIALQNKGKPDVEGRGYAGWILKRENMDKALARKQTYLTGKRGELEETSAALTAMQADNATKTEENKAQEEKNAQLKAEVDLLESQAKEKADKVAEQKDSIKEFGDVDQVLAELTQLQRQLAQIDLSMAQGEAQQAELEAQRAGVDRSLADVRKRINWRVSGNSNPELSTSVRSVYPTLGFVTLNGGDNLGIVKNSRLDVLRDGEVIAKLQVTTVESNSAAADIDPDSIADGESVRVGDQIRAHSAPAAEPAPAPAAPAPAPAAEPEEADPLEEAPEPVEDPLEEDPFG